MKTFANKLMSATLMCVLLCTFVFADNAEKQALIDANNAKLQAEKASKGESDASSYQINEQQLEEEKKRGEKNVRTKKKRQINKHKTKNKTNTKN